jgi:limonene-1,2-epoxide hydrolase
LRFRTALVVALAAFGASCGGGPPSPESVVRAWSESVNSGDNEAAAKLFAPGAQVIQAGRAYTLHTEDQAVRFNASLPCSAEIVDLESAGDTVTATFVLGDRGDVECDGPGAEVTTAFRVRDGKIVRWHQLPRLARPQARAA